LERVAGRLADLIRTVAGILLVVVTLAMGAVIVGRYAGFATAWADEVARIAFIWSVALGAASGTYRGLNFAIPLIATNRRGRTRQVLDSVIALVVVGLCLLMAWATTQSLPVAALARMPALGVTGAWFHAAIATFAVLTAGFMLVKLAQLWQQAPPVSEVG
jgi:TRAP-type C4-dicarboxylate transport system permease small subunit